MRSLPKRIGEYNLLHPFDALQFAAFLARLRDEELPEIVKSPPNLRRALEQLPQWTTEWQQENIRSLRQGR